MQFIENWQEMNLKLKINVSKTNIKPYSRMVKIENSCTLSYFLLAYQKAAWKLPVKLSKSNVLEIVKYSKGIYMFLYICSLSDIKCNIGHNDELFELYMRIK